MSKNELDMSKVDPRFKLNLFKVPTTGAWKNQPYCNDTGDGTGCWPLAAGWTAGPVIKGTQYYKNTHTGIMSQYFLYNSKATQSLDLVDTPPPPIDLGPGFKPLKIAPPPSSKKDTLPKAGGRFAHAASAPKSDHKNWIFMGIAAILVVGVVVYSS